MDAMPLDRIDPLDPEPDPFEEVRAFLATLPLGDQSWARARDAILPLLARRHSPRYLERPVGVVLDPGLRVGFGVDLGPAFLHVTPRLLVAWGITEGELARCAVANLRARARRLDGNVAARSRVGMTPLTVVRVPGGWASSLLLAPDLLGRWLGPAPCIIVAPARDLLVAVPARTGPHRVRRLQDLLAGQRPHPLDVPALAFDGARLTVLDRTPRVAPPSPTTARRPPHPWRSGDQVAATMRYTTPSNRSVR
jgi:hypothetical protein